MIRLLRSYLFWTYERGSIHYDVMVTLILLFLFISPHLIDFHDRPIPEVPKRASEVLVLSKNAGGPERRYVYEIRADDLRGANTPEQLNTRIMGIVHNIAGDATLDEVKPVYDPRGRIVAYDAAVSR